MKHTPSSRSTAIYPITIETPYGAVLLAYRVQDGKITSSPFIVSTDPLTVTSGAAQFWDSLRVCAALQDLTLLCLPEKEKITADNAVFLLRGLN